MAVVGEVQIGGKSLAIAGIHLPSNYFDGENDGANTVTEKFQRKREIHLAEVVRRLDRCELRIICGDFNYDPLRDKCADPPDFLDCDQGRELPTFDCVANPTAAITSKSGKQRRYDRVLIGPGMKMGDFALIGTEQFATKEGKMLCPSDHFGVAAKVSLPAEPVEYGSVKAMLEGQAAHVGAPAREEARRREEAERFAAMIGGTVKVVGSTALGCVLKEGDLDIVVTDKSKAEIREAVRGRMAVETSEDEEVLRVHTDDGIVMEVQTGEEGGEAEKDVQILLELWGEHREEYAR